MTLNPINNQYEFNLAETFLMVKMDAKCDINKPVETDINGEPVVIRKEKSVFIADGCGWICVGHSASVAFQNLIAQVAKGRV